MIEKHSDPGCHLRKAPARRVTSGKLRLIWEVSGLEFHNPQGPTRFPGSLKVFSVGGGEPMGALCIFRSIFL